MRRQQCQHHRRQSHGSISYTDDDSLTVGTVTDTAMASSTTSTGITSGGFDVKLTTTQPLSPLSIAAPVTLGAAT